MSAEGANEKKQAVLGGKELFLKPPLFACSYEPHFPFTLGLQPLETPTGLLIHGQVRVSGAYFVGDRTDVHEMFSLMWAAFARAFGLASPFLIDEPHGFVPGELGARHVVFDQCPWNVLDAAEFEAGLKAMTAWTALASHFLADVFRWDQSNTPRARRPNDWKHQAEWMLGIKRYLRSPDDFTSSYRPFPLWYYCASLRRGVMVTRMPRNRLRHLRNILSKFDDAKSFSDDAVSIFANGIGNSIPQKIVNRALKILALSEKIDEDSTMLIPIDSHCILIGNRTIVAVRGDCGRAHFERERAKTLQRQDAENAVFFSDSVICWKLPLHPGDFEELCLDLLVREPSVVRAKPVGGVNDRDAGRDIEMEVAIPTHSHAHKFDGESPEGKIRHARVITQIKSRRRPIGKQDVQDIRDTLEHHDANAYLLIAHPRISAPLFDHLSNLNSKGQIRVEWWEAKDIESRLRRHPDIARRYPRLLSLDAIRIGDQ